LRLLFAVCFALFPCSNYNAGAFRFLPVLHPVTSGGSRVVPVGPLVLPSEEVFSLGSMVAGPVHKCEAGQMQQNVTTIDVGN